MPERCYRVLLGSLSRRHQSKNNSHRCRNAKGNKDRHARNNGKDSGGLHNYSGEDNSEDNPDKTTGNADDGSFGNELKNDVVFAGTDGHSDADFADALHHRGKHNIHDSDATNNEWNAGNGAKNDVKNVFGALFLFEQQLG